MNPSSTKKRKYSPGCRASSQEGLAPLLDSVFLGLEKFPHKPPAVVYKPASSVQPNPH